jgi:acyl-CoA thioester hydrolase
VSYGEVDKMGVVYYANYLRWFEIGRAEYIRARGQSYRELEEQGWMLPVVEAFVRYREPAAYDDVVQVCTAPRQLGPVRLTFGYRVLRKADSALLAEGHTVHACMSTARRVRRVPPELLALLRRSP